MGDFSIWFAWKKAFRTLFRNKSKTFPILIILIFSIGLSTVMFDLQDVRGKALDEVTETTNFADGIGYMKPLSINSIDHLLENDTYLLLENYELRMMFKTQFNIKGENYEGLVVGVDLQKKERINRLINEDEKEIDSYDKAMNWEFAKFKSIEEGQEITINYGSCSKKLEIESIGYNSEYQNFPLYENIAFPSTKPYPVFYLDIEEVSKTFLNQSMILANQLLFIQKKGVDFDSIEKNLKSDLGTHFEGLIEQEEHPFIETMREDEQNDRILFFILALILLLGSITTLIIVINKLIEDDMKSISVFQALGANKHEILISFLLFNILIMSIAMLGGIILSIGLNIPINALLFEALNMPVLLDFQISLNNSTWIGIALFSISIISTLLLIKKTFSMDVQQSMKHETQFLKKRNIFEHIYEKLSKNSHPLVKYNFRRIFGRKLHLFALLFSLSFSASLLIYTFGFPDSFSFSLERKFSEIEQWDVTANTWDFESQDNLTSIIDSIEEIKEYEFGIADSVAFSPHDDEKFDENLRLMAYEDNSDFHNYIIEKGKKWSEDKEIMLSKDVLSRFNLKIGDSIYIQNTNNEEVFKFKIIGSVDDLTSKTIYTSLDIAQKLLNQTDKANTLYLITDDAEQVVKKLGDRLEIEQALKIEDIKADLEYAFQTVSILFLIMGIIFMVFGLLLLLILFKSVIDYRIDDYSNMKAIGLYDSEIRRIFILEFGMYFIFALISGYLLGSLMMNELIQLYSEQVPGLVFNLENISLIYYILSFGSILLFSYIYNFYRIKNINIAQRMREKTFG